MVERDGVNFFFNGFALKKLKQKWCVAGDNFLYVSLKYSETSLSSGA